MNQNVFEFETRLQSACFKPEMDELLCFKDNELHWDGYISRLLNYFNLTAEETKTSWLNFIIFSPRNSKNVHLLNEYHTLFDGVNTLPMSDEELQERLSRNDADLFKLSIAYLYKKAVITKKNFELLKKGFEIGWNSNFFGVDGFIAEEFRYAKENEIMSCETSQIYTYKVWETDSWSGSSETIDVTTIGWDNFSRIVGFTDAFYKFINDFKKERKKIHGERMYCLGNISRIWIIPEDVGFKCEVTIFG